MRPNLSFLSRSLLTVVGLSLFAYSLMQQTNIQRKMNQTMAQVGTSLTATTPLVAKTSRVLTPLVQTTNALYQIEQKEEQTVVSLAAMNQHLRAIADSERNINDAMDELYHRTATTEGYISGVLTVNQSILTASKSSANASNQIANRVGQINHLTADSINELHRLNSKLSTLKMLP